MTNKTQRKIFNNAKNNLTTFSLILTVIRDAVAASYSPFGSTTIIKTEYGIFTTKDGKRILESLITDNDAAKIIIGQARSIARNTEASGGGDGTTTGALAFAEIFEKLFIEKECNVDGKTIYGICTDMGYSPQEFVNLVNTVIDEVTEIIEDNKQIISSYEDVRKIMNISLNSDSKLMALVDGALTKIEKSGKSFRDITYTYTGTERDESSYSVVSGYETEFISTNDVYPKEVKWENAAMVSITDPIVDAKTATKFVDMLDITAKNLFSGSCNYHAVVILVTQFNIAARRTLEAWYQNKYKEYNNMLPPIFVMEVEEKSLSPYLNDYVNLEAALGTFGYQLDHILNNIDRELTEGLYSRFKFNTTPKVATFSEITTADQTIRDNRIKNLKDALDDRMGTAEGHEIERAIGLLEMSCVTFIIGAKTPDEGKRMKDAMDDATRAVKSSIRSGYNYGCNSAILNALHIMEDKLSDDMIDAEVSNRDKAKLIVIQGIYEAYVAVTENIFANASNPNPRDVVDFISENGVAVDVKKLVDGTIENGIDTAMANLNEYATLDVINPAQADASILRAASTTALTLGTSNQIVLDDRHEAGAFERGEL